MTAGGQSALDSGNRPPGLRWCALLVLWLTLCGRPVFALPHPQDQTVTLAEDATGLSLTLRATPPATRQVSFVLVTHPEHGQLLGTPPALRYIPAPNYAGRDSFTYLVTDGRQESEVATVTLNVTAINDPPVVAPLAVTIDEDTTTQLELQATDPDNHTLTYRTRPAPLPPSITGTGPTWLVTPPRDWSGTLTFEVIADDGRARSAPATVTVTVRPVNDPPTVSLAAALPPRLTTASLVPLTATASDPEGDLARVQLFLDGECLATIEAPGPYLWTRRLPAGRHRLGAQAIDRSEAVGVSAPVFVDVLPTYPPHVRLLAPVAPTMATLPCTLTLAAQITPGSTPITAVRALVDDIPLPGTPSGTGDQFSLEWSPPGPGAYVVRMEAEDTDGNVSSSPPQTVTVTAETPIPTLRWITPTAGNVFPDGIPLSLSLQICDDPEETIDAVEIRRLEDPTPLCYLPVLAGSAQTWWVPPVSGTWTLVATGVLAGGVAATISTAILLEVTHPVEELTLRSPVPARYQTPTPLILWAEYLGDPTTVTAITYTMQPESGTGPPIHLIASSPPFRRMWTPPLAMMSYRISASASLRSGQTVVSSCASVEVELMPLAQVRITQPEPGAILPAGVPVPCSVEVLGEADLTSLEWWARAATGEEYRLAAPLRIDGHTGTLQWTPLRAVSNEWMLIARVMTPLGMASDAVQVRVLSTPPFVVLCAPAPESELPVGGEVPFQIIEAHHPHAPIDALQVVIERLDDETQVYQVHTIVPLTPGVAAAACWRPDVAGSYRCIGWAQADGQWGQSGWVHLTVYPAAPTPGCRILWPVDGLIISTASALPATAIVEPTAGHSLTFMLDGIPSPAFPCSTPTLTWRMPLLTTGPHTLTVLEADAEGQPCATSPSVTFTVSDPSPVAHVLFLPPDSTFTYPAVVQIYVSAVDPNHAIHSVALQIDGAPWGSASATTPLFTVTGLAPGTHVVTATATNSLGAASLPSVPLILQVVDPAPTVAVCWPPAGTVFPTDGHSGHGIVDLLCHASDVNDGIQAVTVCRDDGHALGAMTRLGTSDYWQWQGAVASGSARLGFLVTNGAGTTAAIGEVNVSIENPRPWVRLLEPTTSTIASSAPLAVLTHSGDRNGTVIAYTFTLDGQPVSIPAVPAGGAGAGMLAPLSPGSHTLTVVAYDGEGEPSAPASVTITVEDAPPVVHLLTPAGHLWLPSGAAIILEAQAWDTAGPIQEVHFCLTEGNTTTTVPARRYPGTQEWYVRTAGLPVGCYSVVAQARDTRGGWGTSTPVSLEIRSRPGHPQSRAQLRVHSMVEDASGFILVGDECSGLVGGTVVALVELTLFPNERIAEGVETITVRISDDEDACVTAPEARVDYTLDLTRPENWWRVLDPDSPARVYAPAAGAPAAARPQGLEPMTFWYPLRWDTTCSPSLFTYYPTAHNGRHRLDVIACNGDAQQPQLRIQQGEWAPAPMPVTPLAVTLHNLILTDVTATPGTVDYFSYDPRGTPAQRAPTISFTLEDWGDAHWYDCFVLIEPTTTSGLGPIQRCTASATLFTRVSTPFADVTIPWDGYLDDGTPAERGTYTFDIFVREFSPPRTYLTLDEFLYKWPYCQSISNSEHRVQLHYPAHGAPEIRADFTLRDICWQHQPGTAPPALPLDVTLTPIGPDLQTRPAVGVRNCTPEIWNNGPDDTGLRVYRLADTDPHGEWRVLFTARDRCFARYRRDRQPTPMIAVNAPITPALFCRYANYHEMGSFELFGQAYNVGHSDLGVTNPYVVGGDARHPQQPEVCQGTWIIGWNGACTARHAFFNPALNILTNFRNSRYLWGNRGCLYLAFAPLQDHDRSPYMTFDYIYNQTIGFGHAPLLCHELPASAEQAQATLAKATWVLTRIGEETFTDTVNSLPARLLAGESPGAFRWLFHGLCNEIDTDTTSQVLTNVDYRLLPAWVVGRDGNYLHDRRGNKLAYRGINCAQYAAKVLLSLDERQREIPRDLRDDVYAAFHLINQSVPTINPIDAKFGETTYRDCTWEWFRPGHLPLLIARWHEQGQLPYPRGKYGQFGLTRPHQCPQCDAIRRTTTP